jgi:hypothetical protein
VGPRRTVDTHQALGAAFGLLAALGSWPGCSGTDTGYTALAAGAPSPAQLPAEKTGPPAIEVQAAVRGVLDAGRHPWLTWPEVTGVLPALQALYGDEPDRFFWFADGHAHPALEAALQTIAQVDAMGLFPADYDGALLAAKWDATRAGATETERALLDVALSVSAMRLVQ